MPPPSCDMDLPLPGEPREHVFELRQLDLKLALAGPGVPGKDVENELGPVEHAAGKRGFQVAQLRRRKVVVEEDQVGLNGRCDARDLFDFSLANERGWIEPRTALHQFGRHRSRRR